MKLTVLLVLIIGASVGNTLTTREAADAFFFAIAECRATIPVAGDITQKFLSRDPLLTREERCFVACVMQRLFLMTDNGYMVKGTFIEAIHLMIPDDAAKRQIAEEIITSCELVHEADICDSAVSIGKCINDGKAERGITMLL